MRKIALKVLTFLFCFLMAFGLASCLNFGGATSSSPNDSEELSESVGSSEEDSSQEADDKDLSREYIDDADPLGPLNEVVLGNVRVQLLSKTLVRIENRGPAGFEDRASYIVTNRDEWTTVEYEIASENNEQVVKTAYYHVHVPNGGTAEDAYITAPEGDEQLWSYQGPTDTNVYLPSPSEELKSWYFTDSPRIIPSEDGWKNVNEINQGWDFDNEATDIFVFLPNGNYRTFTREYTSLTGESELVQLKTLGYWDSRWYAYSAETALQQIEDYTSRGYSIDVLVIDTDWRASSDGAWGSGGIGYDVNTDLFPDMAGFLAQCEALGVDICFNDHPEPVTGTTSGLDGAEIDYRTEKLTMILSLGVDYWWYDRNWSVSLNSVDPDISVYAFGMYAYHFVTQEYLESITDLNEYAERALIMANVDGCLHGKWNYASDISAHRYSIQWTGDIGAKSDDLAQEIYASVFGGAEVGLPYMSSDIGGHNGTVTREMYSRWIQYGALSTICRVHCTHEQYIHQEGRMPWLFGETAEEIAHTYLDMRYRLLPLFYYLSYRNYTTGLPIMARTDINYPEYEEAATNDQYMLGDYILVAPISTAGPSSKIPDSYLSYDQNGTRVAGLKAEYYSNRYFEGRPTVTKVDSNVSFDWGANGPDQLPSDEFSIKWSGYFTVGSYPARLSFYADDVIRVVIDGREVINSDINGNNLYDTLFTTDEFAARTTHSIEIYYTEVGYDAHVYMYYTEKLGNSDSYDTRTVFIPEGTWIDVWSGKQFVGPASYTVTHPLETSPIFVREGSLIALAKNMMNTDAGDWQDMALEVYPSTNFSAHTTLYEDDTKTVAYKSGQFRTTDIDMKYDEDKGAVVVTINPAKGTFEGLLAFTTRNWNIRIHTNPWWGSIKSVKVNGADVKGTTYAKNISAEPFAFSGAARDGMLYEVKLTDCDIYKMQTIEIYFTSVVDTEVNEEYDATAVEFTLNVEDAGDYVDLAQSGEISWISYGHNNAAKSITKGNEESLISYPTSYDKAWINNTALFTAQYGSGTQLYSTSGISSQKDFRFEIQTIGKEAYYVLYVGGNQSTAKVTVADRAGNKRTEYFGDLTGAYKQMIVIHVTDTVQSTLYVTYAMHASEPNEMLTYSYLTVMAGLVSETKPTPGTAASVSATATVTDINGASINLSNISSTYNTVYWEHYQLNNTNKLAGANDIVTNSAETGTQAFFDYKASMSWSNGSNDASVNGNTCGVCYTNTEYVINVAVTEDVKQIVIYTGAWNATGTATLYDASGNLIATSNSWTAGTDGIARMVTFTVDVAWPTNVTIKITPSNVANYGNVTMVAVGVLGAK